MRGTIKLVITNNLNSSTPFANYQIQAKIASFPISLLLENGDKCDKFIITKASQFYNFN